MTSQTSIRTGSRSGYWVVEWGHDWDPSLEELISHFPDIVTGKRVAIASCDSGPFRPTEQETAVGWRCIDTLAFSPPIKDLQQLPTPGFDEWYVYDDCDVLGAHQSFVNVFGFSPLSVDSTLTERFWIQATTLNPRHILGAGTPNLFLVTRDVSLYEAVVSADGLRTNQP